MFELNLKERELRKEGKIVKLQEKPLQLLLLLLENPRESISREQIRQQLWSPDTFVEFDDGLNHAVKKLRRALGDSAAEPRFIETLPGRGYRFLVPVHIISDSHGIGTVKSNRAESAALAVLPFVNLTSDPENEYFGDGLAEEILNALTRLPGIRVAARASAFRFRGPAHDLEHIANTLKVQTMLTGSVRRASERVRVTVQLVDLPDGYQIWSERYDCQMSDIFGVQDEITRSIVDQLKIRLGGQTKQPFVKRVTHNLAAYHAYLEGHYFLLKLTPENLEKGKRLFEQAITEDPNYAAPVLGLSQYHFFKALFSLAVPKEAIAAATELVQKALKLDPSLEDGHCMSGILLAVSHHWEKAEFAFQKALALNPDSASVRNHYAFWALVPLGRVDDAIAQNWMALESDPLSPLYHFVRGWLLYLKRDYDGATEECRKVQEIEPSYFVVHRILAKVYWQNGRFADALTSSRDAAEPFRMRPSTVLTGLGITSAAEGRVEEARRVLSQLKEMASRGYIRASAVADIHMVLGDLDDAWRWFERAVDDLDPAMIATAVDPFFDAFRSDIRYIQLLRRMGLPASVVVQPSVEARHSSHRV
jgi:TolB-like protein/Tfp pilus assembly protein PilF